jgi:hypothetical protein
MSKSGALAVLALYAGFTLGIGVVLGDGWVIITGILLSVGSMFYYHCFVRPEENE